MGIRVPTLLLPDTTAAAAPAKVSRPPPAQPDAPPARATHGLRVGPGREPREQGALPAQALLAVSYACSVGLTARLAWALLTLKPALLDALHVCSWTHWRPRRARGWGTRTGSDRDPSESARGRAGRRRRGGLARRVFWHRPSWRVLRRVRVARRPPARGTPPPCRGGPNNLGGRPFRVIRPRGLHRHARALPPFLLRASTRSAVRAGGGLGPGRRCVAQRAPERAGRTLQVGPREDRWGSTQRRPGPECGPAAGGRLGLGAARDMTVDVRRGGCGIRPHHDGTEQPLQGVRCSRALPVSVTTRGVDARS